MMMVTCSTMRLLSRLDPSKSVPIALSLLLSARRLSAAAAAASPNRPPISPAAHRPPESDRDPTKFARAICELLSLESESPLSDLDRVYRILSAAAADADDRSLCAALASLRLTIREPFVLAALRHRPHPSLRLDSCNALLVLRLRFFDWSGRQPGYHHTRSVYHAVFCLLSHCAPMLSVLDWLRVLDTRPSSMRLPGMLPRHDETLVVGYSVAGQPELAIRLLSRMRFRGLDLDSFSYNILLNSLVECSAFDDASSLLRHVYSHGLDNPVTKCIHIKSLCRQNKLDEAHEFLLELSQSSPSLFRAPFKEGAIRTLVKALCASRRLDGALRLVDELGASCSCGVWVSELISAGRLDIAMDLLEKWRKAENFDMESFDYNKLIYELLRNNLFSKAYELLVKMREEGISPNRAVMEAALCSFCKAGMVDVAVRLYKSRLEVGMKPDLFVYNCLISALCREESTEELLQVLEESLRHGYFPEGQTFKIVANTLGQEDMLRVAKLANATHFRSVSGAFARHVAVILKSGKAGKARLFHQMNSPGNSAFDGGRYTIGLIKAFVALKKHDMLHPLVIDMLKHGRLLSGRIYISVVCCLCEMGGLEEVIGLLKNQLQFEKPDERTCYNYFIAGAVRAENHAVVRALFDGMREEGLDIMDAIILILKSYLKSGRISEGLAFYSLCVKKPNFRLCDAFVTGLCEAGNTELAFKLWNEARVKELIPSLNCYEGLVHRLCSAANYSVALWVLEDFMLIGYRVSSFLYNVLLLHSLKSPNLLQSMNEFKFSVAAFSSDKTWSSLRRLIRAFPAAILTMENAVNLDKFLKDYFPVDIFTFNMLLRFFSKAGRTNDACYLFSKFCEKGFKPDRWSFDILVHGFCKQGRRKEAEEWMVKLYHNGFRPCLGTERLYEVMKFGHPGR